MSHEQSNLPESIWVTRNPDRHWYEYPATCCEEFVRRDSLDDSSILAKFYVDVKNMLYPNGIKHPQQAKPEWLLKELRKQLRYIALAHLTPKTQESVPPEFEKVFQENLGELLAHEREGE